MSTLDNAYAILIGVGDDLPASVRDAEAIYRLLSDKKLAGYKEENITLLINEDVTNKKILAAFDSLIEKIDEDSSVILFYSGHGGTYTDNDIIELEHKGKPLKPEAENESHYYLVPNNWNPKKYRSTWLLASDLKKKIQALKTRRLILFLDCCHAEGMTKAGPEINSNDLKERLRNPVGLMQRIDDGAGMSIISSCRAEEKSWIIPEEAENSLFTDCLLEVLQGQHKDSFDEPYIRMTDVINHLMRKVPEVQPIQRPFVNLQMYDNFILSRLPDVAMRKVTSNSNGVSGSGKSVAKELVTNFRDENSTNAVIFVHGFSGEASDTFGNIPQYIIEDPKMKGWDMFPLGYSENVKPSMGRGIWASVEDITRISDNLSSAIEHKFKKYKRIAIVCHSLGGLVVQRALLDLAEQDINRVSHVILFGCPSAGVDPGLGSKGIYKRLKELYTDQPFIKNLRKDWNKQFGSNMNFAFKVVAGTEDDDIPVSSSLKVFDKEYRVTVSGKHFSMVQPEDQKHDGYQLIVSTLTNTKFLNEYTQEEAINNLLGDYDAVIKKLLPKKDTLNVRGLKQLLFALEGMDRDKEVMEILNNHPNSKENTDLLGMLAGRHKRNFLYNHSEESGALATEFYDKGFKISTKKKNIGQIYYHGINRAFMSLVYDDDQGGMQEYAEKALEAAKKDKFDSVWKNATLAEAYMYLAKFKKAKKYYALAAENAGIREKISIHTNAYTAYTNLMNTEDDDFVKFLKDSFLS
jgi:pimeloyl-ACP methyl ester carboxylesterase